MVSGRFSWFQVVSLFCFLKTKGGGLGTGLPHCHCLLVRIGACFGVPEGSGDLAVLGQVEGGDLLGLLDLLLVGLHLALQLVDQRLHPLVVLTVLVSGEGQLLDGPLGLAQVLRHVSEAPALSVKLRLKLADAGLHLDHGLPASLQGRDLGLIGAGGGVLALGLKQLLVLLQVHGELLLATELISKTGSVNHGAGSLVLRHLSLVGHLVEVSVELAKLTLKLPLGGGDGLVDVGEVSQSLIGVSELLLSSTALTVGSLKKSTSLLKTIGNGSGPAVSGDLGVGSGGLGGGLVVHLGLSVAHLEGELLGLPVHGGVEDLGLVEAAGHLGDLGGNLALGLLNLVQLGVQVVDGGLGLSQTGSELHLGHLELLTLGNGVGLVLLTPALGLPLSLGDKPQGVLAASGLLLKSAPGSVKLVLKVPVLAQKKSPLASLVVAQGLDIVELGGKGSLLLSKDVQVVVQVTNNAEKVRVLAGNLVLAGCKVSKGEVGIVHLLVDGVESLQHLLVGHVSGGLGPHHLVSGSAGICDLVHDEHLVLLDLGLHLAESVDLLGHLSRGITLLPLQVGEDGLLLDVGLLNVLPELSNLSLPLLVELNLGGGGAASLVETLTKLVDLPGKVRPLPLGLGAGLALGLQLLLHGLNAALDLLDSLLGLGDQVLLVVELGRQLSVVLLLVADGDLEVPLGALKLDNTVLGHLQVTLNLPLLLLDSCPGLLLLVQAALELSKGGLKLGLHRGKVVNLLVGADHVIVGLGLVLSNVLLLLVELVDDLVLLCDLVLEHLDGVVTVALLKLNLGNCKLDVLNLLLHHTN